MKPILFAVAMFSISFSGISQSKLGEVACVYITTTNLDSSVEVYKKLGFSKIANNDYPSPWAQVSDGSLLIILRKDDKPYIGLTYYSNNVEKLVDQLEKDSVVFSQKPKEGDVLKRYYIKSPDGFTIVLSNNLGGFTQPTGTTMLTMKQTDFFTADKYPNKQCGVFGEFAQPVTDINTSLVFWRKLGFTAKSDMKQPYPYSIISDGLMIIGLHQAKHFNTPTITYFGLNTAKRVQQLKENGLQHIEPTMGNNNFNLTTWEGQHFFIFSVGM